MFKNHDCGHSYIIIIHGIFHTFLVWRVIVLLMRAKCISTAFYVNQSITDYLYVQCIGYTGYTNIVCYMWRVYCIRFIYSRRVTENHKIYRDDRPLV